MKHLLRIAAMALAILTLTALLPAFSYADAPKNICNAEEVKPKSYCKGGKETVGRKYDVTGHCPVAGAEKVYAGIMTTDRNSAVPYFEFYAADGSFLSDAFAADVQVDPVSSYYAVASAPVPAGAASVRVNFPASDLPQAVSTSPFTYEEYMTMTGCEKQPVRKDSPLYGKKILFCGDSICEAYVEKDNPKYARIAGWAGRIGTYNNMDFVNKGLGGAAFSYFNPEKNPTYLILTQLQQEAETADSFDLVLLHGGVNDMWDKVPRGEISESRDPKDFDMETFAGAMEATFCYAKETYKNAAIGFLINFQTHSGYGYLGNSKEMKLYWELAKQICDKWEIPYLDMYNEMPFKRMHIPTDHGGDGIHPIYEGYEMLYPHIEKFVESLVPRIPEKEEPTPGKTSDVTSEITSEGETPDEKSSALPYILGGAGALAVGGAAAAIAVSAKKKKKKD